MAELIDFLQSLPWDVPVGVYVVNVAKVASAPVIPGGKIHLGDVVLPLVNRRSQTVKKAQKHARSEENTAMQLDPGLLMHKQ